MSARLITSRFANFEMRYVSLFYAEISCDLLLDYSLAEVFK